MNRLPALLLAAACLLALAAAGAAEEDLEHRCWELRRAGDFEQALDVARRYRASLTVTDRPSAETAADADHLVASVKAVLALPPEGRRAVAQADSLRRAVLDGFGGKTYEQCLVDVERELELRRKWQGAVHVDVARSLYIEGRLRSITGDDAGAEASLSEAADVQRQVLGAEHSATARTLQYVADHRYRDEDYATARDILEEVVRIYGALYGRADPSTIGALDYLATLTDLLGEEERAAGMREECARLTRNHYGTDSPQTAAILRRLAISYRKLGRLDDSVATYEESLAILRRTGEAESADYATGLTGLAVVLQRQGDLNRAEPLYHEALVLARRTFGDRHVKVARFLGNLAFLAEAQGRYARGAELYREALEIQRESLPPTSLDLAQTLDNLAALERARGHLDAALPLYLEALTIRRDALGDRHADIARSLNHVAEVNLVRGRTEAAERDLRESLAIRREIYGDDHPMVAVVLVNLADVAGKRGDWAAADSLLVRSLAIRRDWLGPRHPDVGRTLLDLAAVRLERDRPEQARELLEQATAIYEDARLRSGLGLTRATSQLANPYGLQAAVALDRDDLATAWTAVEKLRARALADILATTRHHRLTATDAAREDSLRRRLLDSEQRLLASRQAGPGAREETQRLRLEHESAESAWAQLRRDFAGVDPAGAGKTLPADSVRYFIGEAEALVGWFDAEFPPGVPQRWAYVVTRTEGPRWIRLSAPPDTVDAADALRRALRDPRTPREVCTRWQKRVHAERLAPIVVHLADTPRLVVVPGDAMLGVPIETLVAADGTIVADRFVVSYAPSATVLAWLQQRRDSGRDRDPTRGLLLGDPPYREEHLLAMADNDDPPQTYRGITGLAAISTGPTYSLSDSVLAQLPRLAGTRTEISTISKVLPQATVLLGAAASEQELVRLMDSGRLSTYHLIHLATHAIVNDERPGRSALVLARTAVDDPLARALAEGRIYDGLLTADEIVAEWELDADLVVLSACETGLGRHVAGEGYIGFTHAFLQVGARAVLVSLWPVDDRSTGLLMARFYENLLGEFGDDRGSGTGVPMAAADALFEAKQHLRGLRHRGRQAYDHPFYWSPFVLIGVAD